MMTIKDYILLKLEEGKAPREIAGALGGISTAMVSKYKSGSYFPSIRVALYVYSNENIFLHPYAKESLEKELK